MSYFHDFTGLMCTYARIQFNVFAYHYIFMWYMCDTERVLPNMNPLNCVCHLELDIDSDSQSRLKLQKIKFHEKFTLAHASFFHIYIWYNFANLPNRIAFGRISVKLINLQSTYYKYTFCTQQLKGIIPTQNTHTYHIHKHTYVYIYIV